MNLPAMLRSIIDRTGFASDIEKDEHLKAVTELEQLAGLPGRVTALEETVKDLQAARVPAPAAADPQDPASPDYAPRHAGAPTPPPAPQDLVDEMGHPVPVAPEPPAGGAA
jgi:hypothetical protein